MGMYFWCGCPIQAVAWDSDACAAPRALLGADSRQRSQSAYGRLIDMDCVTAFELLMRRCKATRGRAARYFHAGRPTTRLNAVLNEQR
jgi:hypothetical protein